MHGCKHAWLVVLATVLVGCNQSEVESISEAPAFEPGANTNNQSIEAERVLDEVQLAAQEPGTAVQMFLQSLRDGNESTTGRLLTQKARTETAKHDMVVRPPGSSTAQFVVGEVVYTTEAKDIAHVESNWTDIDDAGKQHSYEIVWILRRESYGWAVAGMATELFSGESPLVMNFEDPMDMWAQQQRAELEMARRGNETATQGQVLPASHSAPIQNNAPLINR